MTDEVQKQIDEEDARDAARRKRRLRIDIWMGIAVFATVLTLAAAWMTNLVWTFEQEAIGSVVLGIVGALAFPLGVAHGIWLWF